MGVMEAHAPSPSLPVRSWDEQLRARGYRVTPQRQLVLEAVARLDHATPEEIGSQVQQTARGVNISTIYRALDRFKEAIEVLVIDSASKIPTENQTRKGQQTAPSGRGSAGPPGKCAG